MAKNPQVALEGTFEQVIFAPDGSIEGALLAVDDGRIQLVLDKHDTTAGDAFAALTTGQRLAVDAVAQGPSPKGVGEHPVYALGTLRKVDGRAPKRPARRPARAAAYNGVVVRINYARHGARNGVVLDSGDFIHLKPDGMSKLRLEVGDTVAADGDAWPLSTGHGFVVEATVVNGKPVQRGPK